MRSLTLTTALCVVALAISGCKSRESHIPGSWSGGGVTVEFKEDKSWNASIGPLQYQGTWTFSQDTVTATPVSVNGKPVAQAKQEAEKVIASNPMLSAGKALVEEMDKPDDFKLSEDNKTLTLTKQGQTITLTKGE